MSEWQPIETAPKDGTPVLILADGPEVFVGYYGHVGRFTDSVKGWIGHEWGYHKDGDIRGWMPLPDLPETPSDPTEKPL